MTQSPQHTGYRETIYIGPPPPAPRNSLGTAGFLISLFSPLTLGLIAPLGFLLSLLALRKAPRGWAMAGVLLGGTISAIVGSIGYAGYAGCVESHRRHANHKAASAVHQGEEVIEEYRAAFGIMPDGIEGNKKIITRDITDPWGEYVSYEREKDGYRIRSAGPDKEFNTGDDVKSKFHRVMNSEIPVVEHDEL